MRIEQLSIHCRESHSDGTAVHHSKPFRNCKAKVKEQDQMALELELELVEVQVQAVE